MYMYGRMCGMVCGKYSHVRILCVVCICLVSCVCVSISDVGSWRAVPICSMSMGHICDFCVLLSIYVVIDVDLGMWCKQCVLVYLYVMCVSCEVGQGTNVSWRAVLGSGEVLVCFEFPAKFSEVARSLSIRCRGIRGSVRALGLFSEEPTSSTPS